MASTEGCSLALSFREDARPAVDPAELVDTYSTLLFRIAYSVLRSRPEAEDVVQDVFIRVLEHRLTLSTVRDMRVWLVRIAWNLALDRKRRKRPEQLDENFARSLVSGTIPADAAMVEAQRFEVTLREVERLPRAERHVLLLSALEELSTVEIAGVLGRSESAVRGLLSRARARLRERLEGREADR
ncbi:MAG: sigma-70 family RNA polymerase sigma factor [Acidobacteriaceae bacterium]|jgi:RNA polymerase sigma-70 factor (ECF subfamily)